jgi:hypothetical protein
MRPAFAVTILLAAGLIASVATAQNNKITATFESLAASGVSGDVTLNPMPSGEIQLHSTVKGLVPNTQYTVFVFDQNQTCGDGTNQIPVATITANPAGNGNFNQKVPLALTSIRSIGIRQTPENTLVACASVPQ